MPFIPNAADAFHESQASPDSGHFEALRAGSKATGVISGGAVTAQGTPDMTVAVAAAVIAWEGTRANVAAGNLTLTADGTDPRFYLIVASSAGVKSAVAGTPAPEMEPGVPGPAFPAIPASSVVLASVYVPAADTDIDANQIDDMRVFVVPPEPTTNYDLSKALSIPLVKERSQTVTLDSGENQIHGFIKVEGKLFASTQTNPAILIRFNNLEDLTDRTDHTYDADGQHDRGQSLVYVPQTGKVYLLFGVSGRTVVSEINPSTMAVTDVINTAAENSGNNGAMCSDGTHLYIVTYTSPSKILKYQLSDFALVAQVTLTGRNSGHAMVYDQDRLYAAGNVSPPWIAKINPTDLTFTDAVITSGFQSSDEMISAGDHIWFGGEQPSVLGLLRIDKETLAVQELLWTEPLPVYSLFNDGRWVWVAHNATPGKLTRVDPQSGETWTHTFESGFNDPNEIASDGERLFITTYTSPSKVKRLVPPPLTVHRSPPNQFQVGGSLTGAVPVLVRNVEHVTDGNVGSSEEQLGVATLTANTLSADKKAVRVTASGKFAANANAKRVLLKFGLGAPVTVFDTGSLLFNDANWWLEALCVRTGEDAQKWMCKWTSDSSLLATDVTPPVLTTQNDASSISILVKGVGVAASDVTCELLLVEMIN